MAGCIQHGATDPRGGQPRGLRSMDLGEKELSGLGWLDALLAVLSSSIPWLGRVGGKGDPFRRDPFPLLLPGAKQRPMPLPGTRG